MAVSVAAPLPVRAPVPLRVKEPTVSLKVAIASVAPLATVTAAPSASRLLWPSVKLPLLTLTVLDAAA